MHGEADGEASPFYEAPNGAESAHLALRWQGKLRYIVPRNREAQRACWALFQPGRLGLALRAMARWPSVAGASQCRESGSLKWIRGAIPGASGLSCCRTGAEGPWHKDTILLLDSSGRAPHCIIKAGASGAIGALLQNEAAWLRLLRQQPETAGCVPELIAAETREDLCFLAQSPVAGEFCSTLGAPHMEFLQRLQASTLCRVHYQDSQLYRTLHSRLAGLKGVLPRDWIERLERAVQRVDESLSGAPIPMAAAHNDFIPWNIRIERGAARAFDWEYAAFEQLPLFDPLHFSIAPSVWKGADAAWITDKMEETAHRCREWLGEERCRWWDIQGLAYMTNLCMLYLWAARETKTAIPVLIPHANAIDRLCRRPRP